MVLEPDVHRDERGFFVETLRGEWLERMGVDHAWVQDNHSRSVRGVLRGLHFQTAPGQAKLVRCARGRILDVVVDLRRGSPAYGEWFAVELDDVAHRAIYIPVGLAHGFVVLSDIADVVYRCSAYYDAATEGGIRFDDPTVGVAWPDMPVSVSARDRDAPTLDRIAADLPFTYPG